VKEVRSETVNEVMNRLAPEARIALEAMAEMQKRPPEDVLRDEIQKYIAGKLPAIDIDAIMQNVKTTAYQAGYIFGSIRNFARKMQSRE
jgi:uncharacterized membrane protein